MWLCDVHNYKILRCREQQALPYIAHMMNRWTKVLLWWITSVIFGTRFGGFTTFRVLFPRYTIRDSNNYKIVISLHTILPLRWNLQFQIKLPYSCSSFSVSSQYIIICHSKKKRKPYYLPIPYCGTVQWIKLKQKADQFIVNGLFSDLSCFTNKPVSKN